jgi:hypothetical protein
MPQDVGVSRVISPTQLIMPSLTPRFWFLAGSVIKKLFTAVVSGAIVFDLVCCLKGYNLGKINLQI